MAYVHVAHNCVLGDQIVIANSVSLAGHVQVESQAVIGGCLGIHQFVQIGRLAMVGGMSRIDRDVPPFMLVEGNPARVRGHSTNWASSEQVLQVWTTAWFFVTLSRPFACYIAPTTLSPRR